MTSRWVVLAPEVGSWDPRQALMSSLAELGRASDPAVSIADVTALVSAVPLPLAEEWVTPADVDRISGVATAKTRGGKPKAGHLLGANLHPNDVLVPRRGFGPCVLVDVSCESVAFSEGFLALRCREPAISQAAWALLSSTAGSTLREQLLFGDLVPHLSWDTLKELQLHLPSLSDSARLGQLAPTPRVRRVTRDTPASRWRFAFTQEGDWASRLLGARLSQESQGTVADLARIAPGRVRANDRISIRLPDLHPVCTPEMVRAERWTEEAWAARGDVMTDGRSAVIPSVPRFHIAVPPPGYALSTGAFLLVPNPEVPQRDWTNLIAWMNAADGQGVLEELASWSNYIPQLSAHSLSHLPVPIPMPLPPVRSEASQSHAVPLSQILEEAWR